MRMLSGAADERDRLLAAADRVRSSERGDVVHFRGIIEFSNHCQQDCLYCGLRRSNTRVRRYRMTPEEIVEAAVAGSRLGLRTVVLQSGEDPWFTTDVLAGIISSIKHRAGVAITLSVGVRPKREYRAWRDAGADRYLLKFETSDDALFALMKPGCALKDRLRCLEWLRGLGYEVGSGIIVGLPGQTLDSIAGDVLLLRGLEVDMASAGPFIPHGDTPLGSLPAGSAELSLKVIAIMRLYLPWANIPATTALGTLGPLYRAEALRCGANVIMPNITPQRYRPDYEIYPGKAGSTEEPRESFNRLNRLVAGIGLTMAGGYGWSGRRREEKTGGARYVPEDYQDR
ncbi:MAG: [FeFe] hydrogenase H-cluster radical SAM maturase HydE [Firmicutes bacterium]|nr:[FeFe] hydrogenase H-cluster radical SAM maturase HydE [Bacillota bacterium]